MAHQWDRGVLNASSWHELEEIGTMATAEDMIRHGDRSGALPVELQKVELFDSTGLLAPVWGTKALYETHDPRIVGAVGSRYRATQAGETRDLIRAACDAGAQPTGVMSLREGARVVMTFDVGSSNGLRTNLVVSDAYDGSLRLDCGFSTVRVVCANTLAAAERMSGNDWARLRHTASLEQKVILLGDAVGQAIASGSKVKDTYEAALGTSLHRDDAGAIFDKLFPAAPDDAPLRQKTIAQNRRNDATAAMALPCNDEGATVATLWNAATFIVDRRADGSPRPIRGGEALDSMLFGSRGQRVAEIQSLIEIVMADGSIQSVPFSDASAMGVDSSQLGASILASMLD
uniref:DUF932 domain-containing protein n=1 Tax=viral metagenome TaxID=1070528 RepID=A0A6H1ZBZ9_9ZZZZ